MYYTLFRREYKIGWLINKYIVMGLLDKIRKTDNKTPVETQSNEPANQVIDNDEIARMEDELKRKKEKQAQEEAELEKLKRQRQQQAITIEEFNQIKECLEQRDKEIEMLKKKIIELIEKNEKLQNNETASSKNTDITELTKMLQRFQSSLQTINNSIVEENVRLSKENEDLESKLDSKQERLEQIMRNCEEDRYRKDKSRLINRIIYQSDCIRQVINNTDNIIQEDLPKFVDFLCQQLVEINIYMETTLRDEGVYQIQNGKDGADLDLDYQEVIRTVATDNPELSGKIHRSINPGYVWNLPYILKAKVNDDGSIVSHYHYLIRPEQVVTYKYNKQNN